MKILVVDDEKKEREAALIALEGHDVTVVGSYDEAMDLLAPGCGFEVVLSDLMMPISSKGKFLKDYYKLGALFPYGLFIALRAAIVGCKYAAVITQGNHHEDVYSAAFDRFGGFQKEHDNRERYSFDWGSAKPFIINQTKTIFSHAPFKDGAKDWSEVLFTLREETGENHEIF